MFHEPWQLALAAVAAFLMGVSKTGVAGIGILVTAIFANLLPARVSSGFVLPMLVLGDLVAFAIYRRHAHWGHLLKLFPWTALGVVAGTFTMGKIDDQQAGRLIGVLIAAMVVWHVVRRARSKLGEPGGTGAIWIAPVLGIAAGFTSLVANAAGPVMAVYLLAMGLPKLEFAGTAAVFFMVLNVFKLPFMAHLGLISEQSLLWNLRLAPVVLFGTWLGKRLMARIPQRLFENTVLVLGALAAIKLF